jgi:hypothetical protein
MHTKLIKKNARSLIADIHSILEKHELADLQIDSLVLKRRVVEDECSTIIIHGQQCTICPPDWKPVCGKVKDSK